MVSDDILNGTIPRVTLHPINVWFDKLTIPVVPRTHIKISFPFNIVLLYPFEIVLVVLLKESDKDNSSGPKSTGLITGVPSCTSSPG